jgi:integrase
VGALRRKSHDQKPLNQITELYRGFFQIHNRIKSERHVAVIDPARYEKFLRHLSEDNEAREVLFYLIVSAGLRITEALNLQRSAFEVDGENLFFFNKVLKKRGFVERKSIVHPAIAVQVKAYLLRFRQFDKLFTIDRHQALYQIKKVFGPTIDLHALRHSHISYLIFEKQFSSEEVSNLIKLNLDTVALYTHKDSTEVLKALYRSGSTSLNKPKVSRTGTN